MPKKYAILNCWRCGKSAMVDMANVKHDTRGRPLYECGPCKLALDKLDRKGLDS